MSKLKVMLIWPWSTRKGGALEIFPIGIGYLASNIDRDCFDLQILDCVLDDLAPGSEGFVRHLQEFQPDVVGASWWSLNTEVVEETFRVIRRELPHALLMAGGPHLVGCSRMVVGGGCVDYAFVGEAELGCARLLDAIQQAGGHPTAAILAQIPGLVYRTLDEVHENPPKYLDDLDAVQGIDYKSLRLDDYYAQGYYYGAKFNKKAELTAPIMTQRGCPFHCTFCLAPKIDGAQIRRHSLERIVTTIKRLYLKFGVRYIAIVDDNFTLNKKWAIKVCNAIADLNFHDLTIGTPNGIPQRGMDVEMAQAMRRAGWREVTIAPESGSKRTLEAMRKPVNIDTVPGFIRMFHEVGLQVTAFFIIGYPDETLEDIEMTRKFILENDFDFAGVSIYQPLPGSDIYDRLVAENVIPPGFIPGHYQEVTFRRSNMDEKTLCDVYNDIWNEYRERKGMPIKSRAVARIRERMVVSAFASRQGFASIPHIEPRPLAESPKVLSLVSILSN